MLHKIKSDLICATCCSYKILLLRQRFPLKFSRKHKGICHYNMWCNLFFSPNLHTQSDFMDLSWQSVAPQSIRPCLYNGQFCLFCERNQSMGSSFLCKKYFSPTNSFSTVARLQRCHPLALETYNVLSGDKIFCPLTGILRQVILYNEHLWSQVQAWFQT